jgi:hypothetical protein
MPRITILATLIVVGPVSAWSQDVSTHAATTRLIPYSGVLADGSGAAASGRHAVTFSLFDEREGGALLWTETQSVAADERGRYLHPSTFDLPATMAVPSARILPSVVRDEPPR